MSVDWENTVLETTQNPVGGIILLLIFFFYIFNPVSAYLRNTYLIHDKPELAANLEWPAATCTQCLHTKQTHAEVTVSAIRTVIFASHIGIPCSAVLQMLLELTILHIARFKVERTADMLQSRSRIALSVIGNRTVIVPASGSLGKWDFP